MADFERIRAVKKTAEGRLLGIPGVHAVGIGAKIVAGQRTAEPSIMVYVVKKKAASDVAPRELIPAEIDGVKTDVVEAPRIKLRVDPDESSYSVLDGGIQIQAGTDLSGFGTLGCIAHTEDPDQRIVALTNHHVVIPVPVHGDVTSLIVTVSNDQHHVTFQNANTPGTVIFATFTVFPASGPQQTFGLYVTTTASDTLSTIAQTFSNRINALAQPGVTASAANNIVTITWSGGVITLTDVDLFTGLESDPIADLRVSVAGNVVTLSGNVSGDFYGIYLTIHRAGLLVGTQGTFFRPIKGQSTSSIATAMASHINAVVPGASASASGSQLTVASAQAIECCVSGDVRVGQATHSFASTCCKCCDNRIGTVTDARIDLDCGLVVLDGGVKYKAEIQDIGVVAGSHRITDAEAMGLYNLRKRGRTTLLTSGFVQSLDVAGFAAVGLTGPTGAPFEANFRFFEHAIQIQGQGTAAFSDAGDSGSVVVNDAGEVVALLFGGGRDALTRTDITVATPIGLILDALDIAIATATTANDVRVVPMPAASANARASAAASESASGPPAGELWERIAEIEAELGATPVGKAHAEMIRRHALEAQMLVDRKRAMTVAWHRHRGPALTQAIADLLESPARPLPDELAGRSLDDCLEAIGEAFRAHASPGFVADLERLLPSIRGLGGSTYPEVVERLRGAPPEVARARAENHLQR